MIKTFFTENELRIISSALAIAQSRCFKIGDVKDCRKMERKTASNTTPIDLQNLFFKCVGLVNQKSINGAKKCVECIYCRSTRKNRITTFSCDLQGGRTLFEVQTKLKDLNNATDNIKDMTCSIKELEYDGN